MNGTEVHQFTPGNYFGEIGILGISSKRTATIVAKTLVVTHVLHRSDFHEALRKYPENKSLFTSLQSLAEGYLDSYLRRTVGSLPIFANSNSAFLDAICEGFEERTYKAGDLIVDENKPMTHQVMILVSGKLSVSIGGVPTGELTPGELAIFGEISALGVGGWKPASVRVSGGHTCMVVIMHRSVLEKALKNFPEEMVKFHAIDSKRNRRDSIKLKDHHAWKEATTQELQNRVTFFSFCSSALINELVNYVEENVYPPKRILAEDMAPSQSLLILLDGVADIVVEGARLGRLKSGAMFGEENVLGFPRRTCTLQARTACRTLSLRGTTLWDVLKNEEFAEEYKIFMDLKEQRAQAARHLGDLQLFSKCDALCLQQIALQATRFVIQSKATWEPGKDVSHQGESFAILADGSASLELKGYLVTHLKKDSAFPEGLVYQHGGTLRAHSLSTVYSLRRHALLAAVLHFPKAQQWFDVFRMGQNSCFQDLQKLFVSKEAWISAMKPHPKDQDIQKWASKHVSHRKKKNPFTLLNDFD
eukprot:gnl/MRDRNA2_/MRDRNA2_122731_c0_seq1.p1 gnl/MRDRNA2_/MRDRNA2_122731_c0~~gnl/MRDRNA2_/MRDRNA2_122731_c0_seq1.p1  ORF type:complete len:605 (-),score=106.87 gnl/MRDRNA2_/MRDRNA2_122731_c0_seq1:25-1623(-)